MSHFMTVCPACNIIWEQCRCPDPNKEKKIELCPKCVSKGCKPELSKADKLRFIIRREMDRSLVPQLMKNINSHAPYVKKLHAHPKFMAGMVDELVELQLPFYLTTSDEVADAAYKFFCTPAGDEWCKMAGEFTNRINTIFQGYLSDLVKRLDALEGN